MDYLKVCFNFHEIVLTLTVIDLNDDAMSSVIFLLISMMIQSFSSFLDPSYYRVLLLPNFELWDYIQLDFICGSPV